MHTFSVIYTEPQTPDATKPLKKVTRPHNPQPPIFILGDSLLIQIR